MGLYVSPSPLMYAMPSSEAKRKLESGRVRNKKRRDKDKDREERDYTRQCLLK